MSPDLFELRKWAEQLASRDGRPGRQRAELRSAGEWIGDLLLQGGAQRQVLRVELVDVERGIDGAAQGQTAATAADVAEGERDATRQLALDVGREAMDLRGSGGLVDEVDVAADAGQ